MQKAIYTTVGIDELLPHVQALKGVGARFVQMHAERNVDDGTYRLVYTFINVRAAQEHIAQDGSYAIENLVIEGINQAKTYGDEAIEQYDLVETDEGSLLTVTLNTEEE